MSRRRGELIIMVGVSLLVVTIASGTMLAPAVSVPAPSGEQRTLIGIQGGGPLWHEYGEVQLRVGESIRWSIDAADSYFDVTLTGNGTVLAGFTDDGRTDCDTYPSPCVRAGFHVIDPTPRPRILHEYSFPVRSMTNSEVHDVERLSTGEFLFSDMEHERIVAVKDDRITWQWNASSFYDAPDDPTRTDWLHINDVDVIEPGRYLVSVRNANQLLLIERGSGVVEVINRDEPGSSDAACWRDRDYDGDGDIRCGDPAILDHQHNPQWLGNGTVLVADSDNDRIVELRRTEDGWRPTWILLRAGGLSFSWPRDADRLPDGTTLVTDTRNKRILRVSRNGTLLWSTGTDQIPYEADPLPSGELAGVDPGGTMGEPVTAVEDRNSPLDTALLGLQSVFPRLPYWFGEVHLLGFVGGLGFIIVGMLDAVRYRFRER